MRKMQRQIKFRAWDGDKLVGFGDLMCRQVHLDAFINTIAETTAANNPNGPKYELMQFTGLLDRNGVEIYEGDIVREYDDYDGEPAIIDWNTDDACFRINYDGESDGFYNIDSTMIEVIGNIYENPELLGTNK